MKYVERVLQADNFRLYWIVYWPGIILIVAAIMALLTAPTLYNSFPWFVRVPNMALRHRLFPQAEMAIDFAQAGLPIPTLALRRACEV